MQVCLLQVCLLNYKKDGTPFWNQFYLAPATLGDSSMVTHYLGIQADVTQQVEEAEAAAGLALAAEELAGETLTLRVVTGIRGAHSGWGQLCGSALPELQGLCQAASAGGRSNCRDSSS